MKALSSCAFTSSLVLECSKRLEELSSLKDVLLVWVPGHMGIFGNEEVDRFAKLGASLPFTEPEPTVGVSFGTCLSGF
uniref:Lian-aa1 retrotransposon protein n=1 Tax=Triatoma infestans TaxID=30076 RepID=A0A161M3M3_TRIIF